MFSLEIEGREIRETGRPVELFVDDCIPAIMYYLSCVDSVIAYDFPARLVYYQLWGGLSHPDLCELCRLANLFTPELLEAAGIFRLDTTREYCQGKLNQFFEITDTRFAGIATEQMLAAVGTVQIRKIMYHTESWVRTFYTNHILELQARAAIVIETPAPVRVQTLSVQQVQCFIIPALILPMGIIGIAVGLCFCYQDAWIDIYRHPLDFTVAAAMVTVVHFFFQLIRHWCNIKLSKMVIYGSAGVTLLLTFIALFMLFFMREQFYMEKLEELWSAPVSNDMLELRNKIESEYACRGWEGVGGTDYDHRTCDKALDDRVGWLTIPVSLASAILFVLESFITGIVIYYQGDCPCCRPAVVEVNVDVQAWWVAGDGARAPLFDAMVDRPA
jgi:hypothetical protein